MEIGKVIKLGTDLGLKFDMKTNFPDAIAKGRVVFDGCNGQRFVIESTWPQSKIRSEIGSALITYGKRLKAMEVNRVLSINQDFE